MEFWFPMCWSSNKTWALGRFEAETCCCEWVIGGVIIAIFDDGECLLFFWLIEMVSWYISQIVLKAKLDKLVSQRTVSVCSFNMREMMCLFHRVLFEWNRDRDTEVWAWVRTSHTTDGPKWQNPAPLEMIWPLVSHGYTSLVPSSVLHFCLKISIVLWFCATTCKSCFCLKFLVHHRLRGRILHPVMGKGGNNVWASFVTSSHLILVSNKGVLLKGNWFGKVLYMQWKDERTPPFHTKPRKDCAFFRAMALLRTESRHFIVSETKAPG